MYLERARDGLEHRALALTTMLFGEAIMADWKPIELAKFWSRVACSTDFQCWPWRGGASGENGYGRWRGGMAHRFAYELVHGPIDDGLLVRHRCDNPRCCNPHHLEVGTHADNMRDAVERHRIAKGERHGKTKLTLEQVAYIRANPDRLKLGRLAEMFGVSESTVSYIRSGRSWKVVGAVGFEPTTSAMSRRRSPAELCAQVQRHFDSTEKP